NRIYIKLGGLRKGGLVLLGVDAVHRASFHAQFILGTGVRNYVCHAFQGAIPGPAADHAKWQKTRRITPHPLASRWVNPRRSGAEVGLFTRNLKQRPGPPGDSWDCG